MKKAIGLAFCAIREQAGISQREMADLIGIEQSLICRIETGKKHLRLEEAIVFCQATETKMEVFINVAETLS